MEPSDPTASGMRPSSVPSWMSELKGQPGVPALPPRQRAAHLIDGAAPTSRPRAPIVAPTAQAPKPARRPRRRSAPTKKERAPPRSLTESWESLRLFGRKNLGRRLEEEALEGEEAEDAEEAEGAGVARSRPAKPPPDRSQPDAARAPSPRTPGA